MAYAKIKKWYVTMTDKHMSGWGMAKNKTNKYVVICDTYEQAEIIEKNAKKRSEMIYINITSKKPYYNSKRFVVSERRFDELGEIWTKK
jgi:hypothetical protein